MMLPFLFKKKKGGEIMGRARKFPSAKALEKAWGEYKAWCNSQKAITHGFSAKNSEFVTAELPRSTTYTIEGFCAWAGINRQAFYKTYGQDDKYCDIVTRMREECEIDARMKFEMGVIDAKLAPLWMSRYGYGVKEQPAAAEGERSRDDPITAALKEAVRDGLQ